MVKKLLYLELDEHVSDTIQNNVYLVTKIFLEENCECVKYDCKKGRDPIAHSEQNCKICHGTGKILTKNGKAIMELLKRYGEK